MHANEPVNRYMTAQVLSIDVDAAPAEILRLFMGYPVHHLPVLRAGRVVGMLSSADVLKIESFLPRRGQSWDFLNQRLRVDQLMRQPAVTIGSDAPVEQAAIRMVEHGIHALPVTDAEDRLLGIITTTDIMHAALQSGAAGATHEQVPPALQERLRLLEQVLNAADRYLHAGQDERLHAQLLQAVNRARDRHQPPAALAAG